MTTAVQFNRERVPKEGLYLHYWSKNISIDVNSDIMTLYHMDKRSILAKQLAKFRKTKKALKNTIANASDADTAASLFDVSTYQDSLDEYLNQDTSIMAENNEISPLDLESALSALHTLNINKTNTDIDTFVKQAEDFLNNVLRPTQKTVDELAATFVYEYANSQGLTKQKSFEQLTSNQLSKTKNKIIRDILSNNNGSLFQVKANSNVNVSNTVKKAIMAVAALKSVGDGDVVLKRAIVVHKNSGSKTVNGADAILREFESKIYSSLSYIKKEVSETTKVLGSLKLYQKAFNEMQQNINDKVKLNMSAQSFGNKYFQCKVSMRDDPTFQAVVKSINQSTSRMQNKRSKSDSGIVVYQGSGDNITVIGQLGFSVKESNIITQNATKSAVIKLQDGTPLTTLLKREAGLTSDQYFALIQSLVAHGDDPYYTQVWNRIKEVVTEMAFMSALSGISDQERAYFLVVDNQIFSVEQILQERILNLSDNISTKMRYAENSTGSLDRSGYVSMNQWIGNGHASTESAYIRSNAVFSKVSNKLYNTKIRIDMTIKYSQDLLNILSK